MSTSSKFMGRAADSPSILSVNGDACTIIVETASRIYPDECCGLLIGDDGPEGSLQIRCAVATPNSEQSRHADRFTIDPQAYAAIERRLDSEKSGVRIVGFFHSHPDAEARPSSVDLEMARGLFDVTLEYFIYAIVSVNRGMSAAPRYWRLSSSARYFEEIRPLE